MNRNKSQQRFKRYTIYSLISVYLLILAGGIVRSTGSGMGCPDWPRCFGKWVPPTSESQLPINYKETFKSKRHKKNEKLAKYLSALNMEDLAKQVLNEDTDPINLHFNVRKTYIEYINRVAGVITGIFIFLTFLYSLSYFRDKKDLVYLSFGNLLLVSFQGWIGSLVVSTDLLHWMVTIHMLLTLVIIAILIYQYLKISPYTYSVNVKGISIRLLLILGIATSLIQMIWGTQVREQIDLISKAFEHTNRNLWVANLKFDFIIHRSFSWVIVLLNVLLVYVIFKSYKSNRLFKNLGNGIIVLVLMEVFAGIILSYMSFPAIFQPVHLFLAFVIFGLQFFFLLVINLNKSQVNFSKQP